MRQLDLVVPGLCGPLSDLDTLENNPVISDLIKILSRADQLTEQAGSFHAVLAQLFGQDHRQPLASAELCLLGYGVETGEGQWFHADPVHLQADIDQAFLRDAESLDLDETESQLLLASINNHFAEDGLQLTAMTKYHWFLCAQDHTDIQTTPLADVIGRNVNFFMPQGKDQLHWKRFLNESQMLFHQSEVNVTRDNRGLLPVNSLWLWGEGELPDVTRVNISHMFADNVLCRGLARHCDINHHELDDVATLTGSIDYSTQPLVVLDELFNVSCYGDRSAWLERFEVLFVDWITPLLQHAMSSRARVNLYPCHGKSYQISANNRYRLWRRHQCQEHILSYEH